MPFSFITINCRLKGARNAHPLGYAARKLMRKQRLRARQLHHFQRLADALRLLRPLHAPAMGQRQPQVLAHRQPAQQARGLKHHRAILRPRQHLPPAQAQAHALKHALKCGSECGNRRFTHAAASGKRRPSKAAAAR